MDQHSLAEKESAAKKHMKIKQVGLKGKQLKRPNTRTSFLTPRIHGARILQSLRKKEHVPCKIHNRNVPTRYYLKRREKGNVSKTLYFIGHTDNGVNENEKSKAGIFVTTKRKLEKSIKYYETIIERNVNLKLIIRGYNVLYTRIYNYMKTYRCKQK